MTAIFEVALIMALGADPCTTSADCDDGDPCTLDHCSLADGCWHSAKCDDGTPCTVDLCVDGACTGHNPDDSRCTDGAYCNGTELCDPASASANGDGCVAGSSPCGSSGCLAATCDEANDTCVQSPSPTCTDDGLVCNGVPACNAGTGTCENANVPDCSAMTCPAGQQPVCSEREYALSGNPCACESAPSADQNGNGIPDLVDAVCPCGTEGNRGDYNSCVATAVNEMRRDGRLDSEPRASAVSRASTSSCRM